MEIGMKEFCKSLLETPEEFLNGIEKQFGNLLNELCCQEKEVVKTARLALLAGIVLGARAETHIKRTVVQQRRGRVKQWSRKKLF